MAYKAFKALACPFCGNDTIIVQDSEECQGTWWQCVNTVVPGVQRQVNARG